MKSEALNTDLLGKNGVSEITMVLDNAGVDRSTTIGPDFLTDRSKGALFDEDFTGVTKLIVSMTRGVENWLCFD